MGSSASSYYDRLEEEAATARAKKAQELGIPLAVGVNIGRLLEKLKDMQSKISYTDYIYLETYMDGLDKYQIK